MITSDNNIISESSIDNISPKCGSNFTMENWMKVEGYIVKLTKIKVLSCEKCPRAFTDENVLRQHYERHDLEEQLYQKRLKEYILSSRVVLQHEPIYRCNKCTRGFLNYLQLNDHQIEHTKRLKNPPSALESNNNELLKPHCCSECGLRFVARSTLAAHVQVHAPPLHPCHCGVAFHQVNDLIMHSRLVHRTELKHWLPKQNGRVKRRKKAKVQKTHTQNNDDANKVKKPLTPKKTKSKKIVVKIVVKKSLPKKKTKSKKEDKVKERKTVPQKNTKSKEKVIYDPSLCLYNYKKKNKDNQYECRICRETYKELLELLAHRAIHKMKVTLQDCGTCGRSFNTKAQLIAHEITHRPRKKGESIIWNCNTCKAVFKKVEGLQNHLMIHTGEKPYICHLCPKEFIQASALGEHLKVHNKVYAYKCEFCNKEFKARAALNLHVRTHTGYKPYVCPYCQKNFSDPSAFARHKRIHTGETLYACPYCPREFGDNSAYITHKRRHEGTTSKCPHCHKHYSYTNLNSHIKAQHLKITTPAKCTYCEKISPNKAALKSHIERVHKKIKRYECSYCSKQFYQRQPFAYHVKVKHEITTKEFKCEICNRTFNTEFNKNEHIKHVHCLVKAKYVCDYCHHRYSFKKRLMKHIVDRHLGIRCQICRKTFSTSAVLREHQCITCSVCGLYFIKECYLKRHMITHKGDNQTDSDAKSPLQKIDSKLRHEGDNQTDSDTKSPLQKIDSKLRHEGDNQTDSDTKSPLQKIDSKLRHEGDNQTDSDTKSPLQKIDSKLRHVGDNQTDSDTKSPLQKIDSKLLISNFICDYCNQDFAAKSTLETHIWTVHLVCMYCNVCMKRFYAISKFMRHKKRGCAKVKCEYCDKQFLRKPHLKSHIERIHKFKIEVKTEIDAPVENPLFLRMS